ncbi:DEAD/DEAH box helicase [Hyphomicrobium sp.]|uniref:DEAD/DEAH box helicase n=1 Tax=Hyphomicrobium sp. TaxID=82 RepID=UPI000FC0ADD3|nr:DEAD/DEAH box helicase [Hyphomicrobium sp.]RUO99541.1 MAG: DEAD/DEAH box helicase [Hyphomicrobium sp.]
MTTESFEAFAFAEPLARALTQCGYTTPTPIQSQALPPQLQGRDLLGMAETGSGKTATFLLPILNKIAAENTDPQWKQVSALILAPTRELAVQIDQEVAKLARNMNLRRAVVLGGVSKGPQINALKRGVHILVATPGRLLDHVNMRSCDLSGVQTLVIDEADRMFDMGFIRDIKKIVSLIPQKRRTALFSATMPEEIKKFAYDILHDPYRVDLSSKKIVVDRIDQKIMVVRTPEKQSRLHTILNDEAASRVIVFTRTKRGADRVADRLGMAGISASAFHGNKAQNARQRALNDFTMGHIRVLVATDIAARGIDVSNITHVINFDMPLDPETYVHRVGRTARKGTNGIAISLCDPSERQEVRAIERMMKQPIEVIDDVGGETLPPLPRHRASGDGEAQHREGRGAGRGGEHRHRDGAARSERQAGQERRPAHGRPSGERNAERRDDRQRSPARGRNHPPQHAEGGVEGKATFGVAEHRERAPQGERRPRPDRAPRAERPQQRDERGPRDQHGRSHEANGERRRDHGSNDHHRPNGHRGEHRADHRGENGHDHRHPQRQAEGRHRQDASGASRDREGGNAPRKAQRGGGDSAPWNKSGGAPKFMKRRDDDRNRARPAR